MSRSTTIGTGHNSSVHAAILASIPPGDCEFSPPDAETVLVFGHDPAQWGETPVLPATRTR